MTSVQQLALPIEGISCHTWNADRTQLAISPNNNELHIFNVSNGQFTRIHVLNEHDLLISAVDWNPVNNKIVTCSHDRNAFVWTYDSTSSIWRPTLVILCIDRAGLDVKWSLDGLRFAVTSGSKCVSVCSYEPSNDWWNGQLLATGCADFKCRVFSTFSADVDGDNVDAGPFGSPLLFGEPYTEITALGWVNAVAWSPSGSTLAFAGHDSSIHFATLYPEGPVVQSVRFSYLPLSRLLFIGEKTIVGAGYDFNPMVFNYTSRGWTFFSFIDQKKATESSSTSSGVAAARAMFQNKVTRGQDSKSDADIIKTKHESAITGLTIASSPNKPISKIATSALDGRLVLWDLPTLDINLNKLEI
eukprot:gene19078-24904_t